MTTCNEVTPQRGWRERLQTWTITLAGALALQCAAASVGAQTPASTSFLFGVDNGANDNSSTLLRIDPVTGDSHVVGEIRVRNITDIAFTPSGQLFGVTTTRLFRINARNATGAFVGPGIGIGGVVGLVSDTNGVLFGTTSSGNFIRIDPGTGVGTLVGSFGMGLTSPGDLAFDGNGVLFGTVSDGGASNLLARINVSTGQATIVGPVGFANVLGLTFGPDGTLYGAALGNQLIRIDRTTGAGVLIGTIPNSSGMFGLAANVLTLETFVGSFYEDVLNRAPEPVGLQQWASFLRSHCNAQGFDAIAQGFLDSGEFRTVRPVSLTGLVTLLYETFLDREPDAAGVAAWANVMRQARVHVALGGFIPSQEFRALVPVRSNRAAVEAVVTRFYTEILQRAPEPAGLAAWVNFVVTTGDLETAALQFLVSPEFEARPQTSRDYVTTLYRAFLGREPDAAGLDGWESILRAALLDIVNKGFVPSPEFQGLQAVLCG